MTPNQSSDALHNDLVDGVRRDHNQNAQEVNAEPARASIPMTTAGLAQMRSAIETHVRSQNAVDNMFYQLNHKSELPSTTELAARAFGKLVSSLIDDVKFMAGAIKTRVEYESLTPQTVKQQTSSVFSAVGDATVMFMADAKRSVQAYREEAQRNASEAAPKPH